MKRLGLIGVLLLLGGCGKEDQSFDSKPVVQGVIQYVDMQGKSIGSLRGADIARVELRATANQSDYSIDLFDDKSQKVAYTLPNYFNVSDDSFVLFEDIKNDKVCVSKEALGLKGCDGLTLNLKPMTGEIGLYAKQSPLVLATSTNTYIQNGTMNGELHTVIDPNAFVFQSNRFLSSQRQANLTLKNSTSAQTFNFKANDAKNNVTWQKDRLVREIVVFDQNDQANSNNLKLIHLLLDPETHKVLAADGDCLSNCEPQIVQTGNQVDLSFDQATFGLLSSGQVFHTISGRLIFTITTGQLKTGASTVFAPQNLETWAINNTAHYRFTQLFAHEINRYKELNITVENGKVKQMTIEEIISREIPQTTILATCGGQTATSCQGITFEVDGGAFRFDQVRMKDGSAISGQIMHGGV